MPRVRLDKLIDYWDPQLQKAFLAAVRNIRDLAQIDQITRAIDAGNIDAALAAVNLDPANFRPVDKTVSAAFEAGGNATAAGFPTLGQPGGLRAVFQFNIRAPSADSWLSQHVGQLIGDIVDDQRNMIRSAIAKGLQLGQNPRTTALDLVGRLSPAGNREGGLIGLTTSQQDWVFGYVDDLRNDPIKTIPHYFNNFIVPGRKLRDRRYDETIKKYISDGEKIPEDMITNMANGYKNRALRYRAEAIARTETMAVIHEGQQNAIEQAVESGLVDGGAVSFVWNTAGDKRVRESHAAMDGQQVKLGEPFITGNGNSLEYPGDPEGPPEEIINCRCWREPKIDFLAGVV